MFKICQSCLMFFDLFIFDEDIFVSQVLFLLPRLETIGFL